ncbi:hypothetical protein, partial [Nostoc sp.]|uniref:hypothetical protein n=1 Tax=Nostoc sp. TaxID=1180 RepID=UPI002FFD0B47
TFSYQVFAPLFRYKLKITGFLLLSSKFCHARIYAEALRYRCFLTLVFILFGIDSEWLVGVLEPFVSKGQKYYQGICY